MSDIEVCTPDYPVLKKYKIYYENLPDEPLETLELYIFPEDFKSTYEPKYSKLNSYGIYPYLNLRTHSVNVRYGSRYILNKLEKIALKSLNSGIPIKFGTASDYAAEIEDVEEPPLRFTHEFIEDPDSVVPQTPPWEENNPDNLSPDDSLDLLNIEHEKLLDTNMILFEGFIELPFNASSIIGKGHIIDGFSFRCIEVIDSFRSIKVGDLILKIPPESYSYQEVGSSGSIQYAIDNSVIINSGFVQKGFTVNLPTAYTNVLETLKFYKQYSLIRGGIEILDNVGNSFNGWGYVNALNYGGAITKRKDDLYEISNVTVEANEDSEVPIEESEEIKPIKENNFLPQGLSFSVLSLESFITS